MRWGALGCCAIMMCLAVRFCFVAALSTAETTYAAKPSHDEGARLIQRQLLQQMSPKTLRAAMVFVTALPILMAYPFLQKYFAKGLVLGSVKG